MSNGAGRARTGGGERPLASVVIPAHDEARSIQRCLMSLRVGIDTSALDVVVVCNGCTDDTARRARESWPGARVLELPVPSKAAAVRAGNAATDVFPRVHLDADVRLTGADLAPAGRAAAPGRGRGDRAPHGCSCASVLPPRAVVLRRVGAAAAGAQRAVRSRCVRAARPRARHGSSALPGPDERRPGRLRGLRRRASAAWSTTPWWSWSRRGRLRDLLRRRVRVHTGNAQADGRGDCAGERVGHHARHAARLAASRPRAAAAAAGLPGRRPSSPASVVGPALRCGTTPPGSGTRAPVPERARPDAAPGGQPPWAS